jgi:uncharacterized Fe-S radical SAM superfamily protein PflX
MDQYRPCFKATLHPKLSRRITKEEFKEAAELAKKSALKNLFREIFLKL